MQAFQENRFADVGLDADAQADPLSRQTALEGILQLLCRAEDAVFDAEFDRVREEFERVRKRPRPTHDVARPRRDNAIAEAERQLDADIRHSSCNTAPAKPLQLNGRRHARHELGRTFQRGEGAGRGS